MKENDVHNKPGKHGRNQKVIRKLILSSIKVRRRKKVSHVARICSWCNENTFLMLQLTRPVRVAQETMHGQLSRMASYSQSCKLAIAAMHECIVHAWPWNSVMQFCHACMMHSCMAAIANYQNWPWLT